MSYKKPLHRCRFCKDDFPSYRDLRRHVEDAHSTEFLAVSQWLGKEVQPRIEQLEKIANEGLLGYRERKSE